MLRGKMKKSRFIFLFSCVIFLASTALQSTYGQLIKDVKGQDISLSIILSSIANIIDMDSSMENKEIPSETLHSLLKLLKSSSFPTAVANISNQQCVTDSLLYVHGIYNISSSSRWARQS